METTAAAALLGCAAGMSQVGRADGRWVGAGQHLGGVGGVFGQLCPDKVGGHKAEGTSNVVLGTLVPCLGLDVLEPLLEVGSRVGGEGVSEGDGRGLILRHGGWVDGWMSTSKGLNTTVDPNLS